MDQFSKSEFLQRSQIDYDRVVIYISEYAKEQLVEKHEKHVYDQYSKDLDEFQEGCEGAHQSQDLHSRQAAFHSETSTDAPEFQAGMATRLQSCCYLSEYAKKQLIRKHKKPLHDEHSKDLDEL